MNGIAYDRTETVTKLSYEQIVQTNQEGAVQDQQDVLVVYTDEHNTYIINNHDFNAKNYALQFIAYCGAKPSDLSAAEGTVVPIVSTQQGEYPPDWVFNRGKELLASAVWSPVPTNTKEV